MERAGPRAAPGNSVPGWQGRENTAAPVLARQRARCETHQAQARPLGGADLAQKPLQRIVTSVASACHVFVVLVGWYGA